MLVQINYVEMKKTYIVSLLFVILLGINACKDKGKGVSADDEQATLLAIEEE